jgi:hypothetical protein
MRYLLWCFITVFFFAQGVAPLVHAHPNVQGHGFHFHVNNARVFQISLGKQNETHAMPVLVEQKCLPPGLVWLPLPLAKRFFPPIAATFPTPSLVSLSALFARAPPAL